MDAHVRRVPERGMLLALRKAIGSFMDDDCTTLSAALAYYTVFALPPLLLVIISIVGLLFGADAVQGGIQGRLQNLLGPSAGHQIGAIIAKAGQEQSAGLIGGILGFIALVFGATSAFAQLQASLNAIWGVQPDPAAGGIRNFIGQRILSLVMVIGIALLLFASMLLTAALQAAGADFQHWAPPILSLPFLEALELILSFAMITVLVAAILKILPDARISWRQVWTGAAVTALLFTAGKFLIGLYLSTSSQASVYGAAGSLVLLILWIYYSSVILLLGAEFTKALPLERGHAITPKQGAVLMRAGNPPATLHSYEAASPR